MNEGIKPLSDAINGLSAAIGRPIRLMEVCGTHTVAIFRHGIRSLLPDNIKLLSGPGCPVCVTPESDIDAAIAISRTPETILATFGDMMRVRGATAPREKTMSRSDHPDSLNDARAEGANVKIVYSPLDALKIAADNKGSKTVFFATGFETTSPLVAATIAEAEKNDIKNFYIYPSHKLVPPALRALLDSGEARLDGLILPGHVSTIIGSIPYLFLAAEYGVSSVITGFEAADILKGILMLLKQIETGKPEVQIQYSRAVKREGNPRAQLMLSEVFEPSDAEWRGIGIIPQSGLSLREKFRHRDVKVLLAPELEIHLKSVEKGSVTPCACGEVLRGIKIPTDCLLFGKACTPERPVGPCMVSAEGSCAAYYKYVI